MATASKATAVATAAAKKPAAKWDPRIYGISADYGAIAGTSRGTQIDPGTTANTKPTTYTQLEIGRAHV